jgi:hypothetical protein
MCPSNPLLRECDLSGHRGHFHLSDFLACTALRCLRSVLLSKKVPPGHSLHFHIPSSRGPPSVQLLGLTPMSGPCPQSFSPWLFFFSLCFVYSAVLHRPDLQTRPTSGLAPLLEPALLYTVACDACCRPPSSTLAITCITVEVCLTYNDFGRWQMGGLGSRGGPPGPPIFLQVYWRDAIHKRLKPGTRHDTHREFSYR